MAAPTAAPTLSVWAQRAYDRLEPWTYAESANGYPYGYLIAACATMWEDVSAVTETDEDGTTGLQRTFNPQTAESWVLPMLEYRAGISATPGLTEPQQRLVINALDAANRGKPSAVIAAAQIDPDGEPRSVKLVEGNGTADITVYQSQTPDAVIPLIEARLEQQVPFELWWTLTVAPGWSWDEMVAHYDGLHDTWAAMVADNADWPTLVDHLP